MESPALSQRPRPKPKHLLPESTWSEMPKLEPGPGHDFIHKRTLHDQAVELERIKHVFQDMRCVRRRAGESDRGRG